MRNRLLVILLLVLLLKLLTCVPAKMLILPPVSEKSSARPTVYYMPGIDDSCDTLLYNCVDMRSFEYERQMPLKR